MQDTSPQLLQDVNCASVRVRKTVMSTSDTNSSCSRGENLDREAGAFCIICCEPIIEGAQKCNKCDSYQDWTRYVFRWSGLIAAIVALIPAWGIAVSLLQFAFPGKAEIHVRALECGEKEIAVAAANVGQRTGVIKDARFNVLRNALPSSEESDMRTLTADNFMPIKPTDTVIIKYRPSSKSFEELPRWKDSTTCKYQLTFNVFSSGDDKPASSTELCDCPR